MDESLTRRRAIIALWIIIAFAVALRLPGFWSPMAPDEQFSYDEYIRPGLERMLLQRYQCNNQPLSSLATWGVTRVLGDADWAMRLPAFAMGLALLPVLFLFARRAFGGWGPAVLSAYVAAIHMYHVGYSANFRSYTFVILFATLTAWQLAEHLVRPSWKYVVGISVTIFLMAYSHVVSLILLSGWGLALLVYLGARVDRGAWRDRETALGFGGGVAALAMGLALTSIAYYPAFFLPWAIVQRLTTGTWPPDAFNFVSGAEQREWLAMDRYMDTITGMTGIPFWIAALLAVSGAWAYFRQGRMGAGVVVASLLGPVAALVIANLKIEPRYSLSLLSFFSLALGAGLWHGARRAPDYLALVWPRAVVWRGAVQWIALLLLLPGLSAVMLHRFVRDYPIGGSLLATALWDDKAALLHVREVAGPADVAAGGPGVDMQFDHVADKLFRRGRPVPETLPDSLRVWYLSSPGNDASKDVTYPSPMIHAASFNFCEVDYLDVSTAGYQRVPLSATDWTLGSVMPNGRIEMESDGSVSYIANGGWSDAGFQSKQVPCKAGRLAGFKVWLKRNGVGGDVAAQLVFVDATGMPLKLRVTREPRPVVNAVPGWELFAIDTIVPLNMVACYAEVRWRNRMDAGERVGMRGMEVAVDNSP